MSDPKPAEALYSIGDIAQATGISTETLRIWERRYGRPRPVRLPSGHRRFTATQMRRLRRVAEALSRGMRPGRVMKLPDEELEQLLASTEHGAKERTDLKNWMALARAFRGTELQRALRHFWTPEDPAVYLETHISPFLETVGRAWADGEIEIRHEHFVAEIVEDLLRALRTELPFHPDGHVVVVTTLPEERHRLGIQMAALVMQHAGARIHSLGVDTPLADIVRMAYEVKADAVAIGVSLASGGVRTDRMLAELRGLLSPNMQLIVGGSGARGIRRGPRGVSFAENFAALQAMIVQLGK